MTGGAVEYHPQAWCARCGRQAGCAGLVRRGSPHEAQHQEEGREEEVELRENWMCQRHGRREGGPWVLIVVCPKPDEHVRLQEVRYHVSRV